MKPIPILIEDVKIPSGIYTPGDTYFPLEHISMTIHCWCGLMRVLPFGLKVDDSFALVPCPKCGSGLIGKFMGDKVEY